MTKLEYTRSNVTLDIGENGAPDRAHVSVSYRLGGNFSSSTGAAVQLPPGTIEKSAKAAENEARIAAADLLDSAATFLREKAAN